MIELAQKTRQFGFGACAAILALAGLPAPASAQNQTVPAAAMPAAPTFADLARLTEAARIVAIVEVRDQAQVKAERAPGLSPGMARLYVEARTVALLSGRSAIGESLSYLVDVPLTAKGKAPKLKKQRFIVYATPVQGKPGELQLIGPTSQLYADPELEQRAREVIAAFATPDSVPRITGVRDIISVPGNLAGESETQMFLETSSGVPVSLSVIRRPGMQPQWGVSWSEIVDQSARPPEQDTVEWYRLACSLPTALPQDAYLQNDRASRARAAEDYAVILQGLGPCTRNLG